MSKKLKLILLAAFLVAINAANSKCDEPVKDSTAWKISLISDISVAQTAYSDSWTGGESGSFNWIANVNGSAEKAVSTRVALRSTLKLSYGQTSTQDEVTRDWSTPKKSTDLIDWETVARFTLHGLVDPYLAFRVETEFADASVPAKKRYLSPMRLTESTGFVHRFYTKDKELISTRVGLALRQLITKTFVDDTYDTKNVTSKDGGIESVTDVVKNISPRLNYTGKLSLFKALYFSDKDLFKGTPQENDWKAVDVNWENMFVASITKIIAVNFYTQFLYDKQISRKGRFKQTLGIGFVFKLV